ncbi:MAG: DEAD/DEAH box helicase [Pirellulaceae bacterium]
MKTFDELDLIAPLTIALSEEQYTTPTPIQAQTIPPALEGRDILGCAQTGTGKTAAFALPILNRLGERHRRAAPNRPLVLVLAPTRELAIQIGESFATYGRHLRLRQVLVYGGVNQANQVRALNRGAHILVATPGRLLDLMEQGHVSLGQLEIFVLDEADRMLDMGFLPALKKIIRDLPNQRQSLFFSATMPDSIRELSGRLLDNPVSVNVTPKQTSVERIEQRVLLVERSGKLELIRQVVTGGDVDRAIVFTKTKRGANTLAEKLCKFGVRATAIHGNKSQAARQRALDAFRNKSVTVLVATDVAARGIDIDGITHVVNYDLPVEPESYVHRIGRTGRAGADGIAISFCTPAERGELRAIEALIGKRIDSMRSDVTGGADHSSDVDNRRRRRPAGARPGERSGASGANVRKQRTRSSRHGSAETGVSRTSTINASSTTPPPPIRSSENPPRSFSTSSESEKKVGSSSSKRKTLPKKYRARS